MYQHLTKSFLAGVAALALLVLGTTSILAPAWAAPKDKSTLGNLNCEDKQIAKWKVGSNGIASWECAADDSLDDLECNQGQTLSYDTTLGWICSPEKIVFLSSVETPANMGGPEGADQICNDLAFTAELQGAGETNFMAWISEDGSSAPQRFDGGHLGRYVLPDVEATVVAYTWDDLMDGTISHPIDVAEGGGDLSGSTAAGVWTGTQRVFEAGGEVWGPTENNCANWNSVSDDRPGGAYGVVTHPDEHRVAVATYDPRWSWSDWGGCSVPRRLYCFEQ